MVRGRTGVLVGTLLALLCGCGTGAAGPPHRQSTGEGGQQHGATRAHEELRDLRVAVERSAAGYERDRFGTRWKDVDHNGCDQRNDVLARDLDHVEKRGRCVVVAGRLSDPYTGKEITFVKARAAEVQIDHIYPLALAWRMGAYQWTEDRRERFANDHDNLLAVWGRPNRQKSDSGPAEWRPQKAYQCTYAVTFIAVAHRYGLAVTQADHAALASLLDRC